MQPPAPPSADPIVRFQEALARAIAASATSGAPALASHDPTAMTLATADASGRPSGRIVLLKGVDARGFVFYTNRESRKGRELADNPHAALCILWPALAEQVRIEGSVELVSDEESDAYFASRPRDSQVGAWASLQSQPVASRDVLVAKVAEIERRFEGKPIPRPPHWGGYRVVPRRIEFWKEGAFRIHDRDAYERQGQEARQQMHTLSASEWTVAKLFP